MGRLSTVTDWLGHTTTYGYGDAWTPDTPTTITFPSAIGVTATYGYSNTGNVTSLAASSTVTSGPAISDSWGQNPDEQVNATTINSAAATSETYDGYGHVTHAANLYTSTSNDVFTVAANGEITTDAPPSGSSTSYAYNSGEELCSVNTSASASCTGTPTNGAVFSYTTNGQRASLTPYSSGTPGAVTDYAWNAFGELCNVATSATACGTTPTSGTSYSYNGNGVRMSAVTSSSTTDFTWDNVSAGGTPLDLNDATTTSSGTTNTSYLYGDLLFGGTAPVEQITTTTSGATVSYLVSNQTGVQGVYNGSGSSLGAVQEMAVYSVYGNQNFTSGTKVTPFAFQGSYADPTGLLYLINRYYDPTTDQFLSIDPDVATTDQPYVFTDDDPLNAEDPLGLAGARFSEELLLEYGERIKGGVRGGAFPEQAEPNQVLYRVDGDHITSYQAYGDNGAPQYRVDLTGESHGGVDTPHMFDFQEHTNPQTGETFLSKGPVYEAPEEFVPSQEFQSSLIKGESFAEIWPKITGPDGDGGESASILNDSEGGEYPTLW